ncbi:three-helix bundle dimerization domain-containing protein [Streptomonospora algeriensis]|uniref:Three-helix bundle dimerization domain-containing protein n=1 Tax=Streptomonospora algeriensis TaxID=995084 RepID=A0ABW3BBG0_9ACTN
MPEKTTTPRDLSPVVDRLNSEFTGVHDAATVTRCVDAARQGALDVTGRATPELVERIARQHLQVLALAFSERR